MKRRLLTTMALVTVLAVVLFGVPLGLAAARLDRARAVSRLEREATRAAGSVPTSGLRGAEGIPLPRPPRGVQVALYDGAARRITGMGPGIGGREVAAAVHGRVGSHRDGAWLAVAVPLQDGQPVGGAARAAIRWQTIAADTRASWLVLAALGATATVLAGALARWLSSRLVAPVHDLAVLAIRLGDGDFTARASSSGVLELDRAAEALNRTAERLGALMARERAFSEDASHQLSTPLTSLRLGLESALLYPDIGLRVSIERAVAEVDRLQVTVATLLAVARDAPLEGAPVCDVAQVCRNIADRFRRELSAVRRPLRTSLDSALPPGRCPAEVLQEILAVLVDNARAHGEGAVSIVARRVGTGIVIDVGDDGDGVVGDLAEIFRRRSPGAAGHGIGLALARSLAESHGARLSVSRAAPRPIFTIALAGAE